jgi:hypothetical protein
MSTGGPALPVRSLTEARLYLMTLSCSDCGAAPLGVADSAACYDAGRHVVELAAACGQCGARTKVAFDATEIESRGPVLGMLGELKGPASQPAAQVINPTREPSEIIDVAGWLMLYTTIVESARIAARESRTLVQRAAVRRTQIEAGQCLDEALKFFDEDNDLPPREGFFTERSYRRFLERPELYTRQRLIELRSQFPR